MTTCKLLSAFILVLLFVSGCGTDMSERIDTTVDQPSSAYEVSTCDRLAAAFDESVVKPVMTIGDAVVGGTLLDISGPESAAHYGGQTEYYYSLRFRGGNEEKTFRFYAPREVSVPLSEGRFYAFYLLYALGAVTSSGPQHGMFSYERDFAGMFTPVNC